MPLPPIVAAEAARRATALAGDVYTKRWTTRTGRGASARTVEHELHVNPLVVLGAALVGTLALGAGATALWLTQNKVGRLDTKVRKTYIVREYGAVTKTVTVVDKPAWTERIVTPWKNGPRVTLVTHPAITHEERTVVKEGWTLVMSARGVPLKRLKGTLQDWNRLLPDRDVGFYNYVDMVKTSATASYTEYRYTLEHKTRKAVGVQSRDGFSVDLGF